MMRWRSAMKASKSAAVKGLRSRMSNADADIKCVSSIPRTVFALFDQFREILIRELRFDHRPVGLGSKRRTIEN